MVNNTQFVLFALQSVVKTYQFSEVVLELQILLVNNR